MTGHLPTAPDWITDAACIDADPADFFPNPGDRAAIARGKRICRDCAARATCLAWSLDLEADAGETRRHGIYGGLTAAERHRLAGTGARP